ncbi:MAG: hemerythrin domain-containing protein [Firmicutes bacterium]|nr:hemerythrin domain-containing protein [Bacillota bacterium]
MKPTEELKKEHEAIKLMLSVLDKVSGKLESRKEVSPEHLEKIIEFIKVFADKCHHGKEEDLLFVAMEEAGVPREGGPIGVMLMEHDAGRGYVRGMSDAVSRYKSGDGNAASEIAENARHYINLLTQHIEKEDTILYPFADIQLSEEKQKELMEGFEKIELERVGPGKHEEFHQLLKQLKEIYLG